MSRIHVLAALLLLSETAPAPAAIVEPSDAVKLEQGRALPEASETERDRRFLQQFRAAQLPITQAIEIAERLHQGSRAAAVRFELAKSAGYRVLTVRNNETWENLIDANNGGIAEPETAASLNDFDPEERTNVVALESFAQDLADAVHVAEKAATGKAFGGGLMKEGGRLNFFVVVLSEDELKEVRLEPPKAGRKGSLRYRLH